MHLVQHHRASRAGGKGNELFRGDVGWYEHGVQRLAAPYYRQIAREVAQALPPASRASRPLAVLDIGTGPGRLAREIARLRPDVHVTGVDLSPDMVRRAQAAATRERLPHAVFAQADASRLPFPDGTFDLLISTFSLHHWDDIDPAIGECVRVVRDGGRIWLDDMRLPVLHGVAAASRQALARLRELGTEPTRTPYPVRLGPLRLPAVVRLAAHKRESAA